MLSLNSFDDILTRFPDHSLAVCGDFDRFPVSMLSENCSLKSTFNGKTYGDSQLDFVFMTEDIEPLYEVSSQLPLDNSKTAHLSLLASPAKHLKESNETVPKVVYDLRKSFVNDFVTLLSTTDWSPMLDGSKDVHEMCKYLNSAVGESLKMTIPQT